MEGGGQGGGGRNKVDGMVEGVGRRTEERDWRASGCRSQTEVTGWRTGNHPSIITGGGKKLAFECYSFFVLTNLVVLFNLKNSLGDGQPHLVNNGVDGRIGWTGKRFL